ncbi:hypothetical protein ACHAXA_008537 [Cyclostephanos tholiformis]|uniref:FAD/NAD(P)-binding domain-containing protein n=1 Tax=Cyclostephanos tholiformis TaxID=382380 RepID=A0ABD3R3A7_9STRA
MTKYIVIGAGWLGIRTVRAIESISKDSVITVLEVGSKDYIDINVATPRFMVEPDMIDTAYQPLSKAWGRAELINVKEIKGVESGRVVLIDSNGNEQVLEADGIIVATGAVQSSPLIKDVQGKSKDERKAEFTAFRDAVKNSKAGVLVIGGGTTGVELVAEIATDFGNVKCTLVNKPRLLMNGSSKRPAMHKIVMKQLCGLGVKVVTDDYIEDLKEDYVGEPKKFTTKKGVEIDADVVVVCVGGHPNVPFPADYAVDEKSKGLSVNEAMLCEKLGTDATKPVWAVGDCTMYGGRGMFADPQIKALSASIMHFEKMGTVEGGPMKYKHKPSELLPSLVSVGRRGGAITIPVPNKMLGKALKSKDLGLSYMYKKEFSVKV